MIDKSTQKRDFDSVASEWDKLPRRRTLAIGVAGAIMSRLSFQSTIRAMDFGAGTGLLTLRILPHVQSIVACDSSPGMLDELDKKLRASNIDGVETCLFDIENETSLPGRFDLIVSSMTMHHIPDVAKAIRIFYAGLTGGGQIGIADLDVENGDFHGDRVGVHHLGFDRAEFAALFADAGFHSVATDTARVIRKTIASGEEKDFSVFLLTARK